MTVKPESDSTGRKLSARILSASAPILGGLIGVLIGALLILIAGANPIEAYGTMLHGAFGGPRRLTETILKAGPILMIGLGLTAAFRARVWNIGGEGQYYMGALAGGIVALYLTPLPRPLLLVVMCLAGAVGGFVWAMVPALLKVKAGMNEIISTLMLNYIAILLMEYLVRGPLQEPGGFLPISAPFDPVTRLPAIPGTRIHFGIVLTVLLIPLIYYLLWYMPLGFRMRAIGSRASVARYAGMNVEKTIAVALAISGGLAGLAGIIEVSTIYTRLKSGISGGYGFSGILVALLGRMNPIGVTVASLFFAILVIGAETMHVVANLPPELADAIQAVIVLSVLAVDALVGRRSR